MNTTKNVNGFLFAIIDEETAKNRLKNQDEVFILHNDGTETLAEDENCINTAINLNELLCFELGLLTELQNDFKEGEQNRFRNNNNISFDEWLNNKIDSLI